MVQQLQIDATRVANIKIQKCHRLPGSNARIICKFAFDDDRELIWRKRFSLKGTAIYITEHFPPEIEGRRQKLYPIAKAARGKGVKAVMKYDKVIIGSKEFGANNLSELPKDLIPPTPRSTQTKNGITCFFTANSPLSNFHEVEGGFSIDDKTFDTVERYFQMHKAQFAENLDKVRKIQNARTAAQCKAIGDSVEVNEQEWLPEAQKAMQKACRAKFQNPLMRQALLDTQDTILAEAGPNRVWGTGIKMSDANAFDKDKWGQNLLGKILTSVRNELQAASSNTLACTKI